MRLRLQSIIIIKIEKKTELPFWRLLRVKGKDILDSKFQTTTDLFTFNAYAWSKGKRQKDTKQIYEKEKEELELVGKVSVGPHTPQLRLSFSFLSFLFLPSDQIRAY